MAPVALPPNMLTPPKPKPSSAERMVVGVSEIDERERTRLVEGPCLLPGDVIIRVGRSDAWDALHAPFPHGLDTVRAELSRHAGGEVPLGVLRGSDERLEIIAEVKAPVQQGEPHCSIRGATLAEGPLVSFRALQPSLVPPQPIRQLPRTPLVPPGRQVAAQLPLPNLLDDHIQFSQPPRASSVPPPQVDNPLGNPAPRPQHRKNLSESFLTFNRGHEESLHHKERKTLARSLSDEISLMPAMVRSIDLAEEAQAPIIYSNILLQDPHTMKSIFSILVLPRTNIPCLEGTKPWDVNDTTQWGLDWLNNATAGGADLNFLSIQTEKIPEDLFELAEEALLSSGDSREARESPDLAPSQKRTERSSSSSSSLRRLSEREEEEEAEKEGKADVAQMRSTILNRHFAKYAVRIWYSSVVEYKVHLQTEVDPSFGLTICREPRGFIFVVEVSQGSVAERAGVKELLSRAQRKGKKLLLLRLEGQSVTPSCISGEGLVHCITLRSIMVNMAQFSQQRQQLTVTFGY